MSEQSTKLVRDLMTVGVATCSLNTPLPEVVCYLLEKNLESIIVLDEEGHAAGMVSHEELIRVYGDESFDTLTAEQVMRADIPQLPPDIPLTAAAQLMLDMKVRAAYMMHHAGGIIYPAAMLSYRHLLRHLAAKSEEDLDDLGIEAKRRTPVEVFIEKRDRLRKDSGLR